MPTSLSRGSFLLRGAVVVLISLLGFARCSSESLKSSENVEDLYSEANRLIEKERFIEAREYLAEIKRRFPQSRFALLSDLRSADMEFQQENFTEAAAAYGVFVELYPNHISAPYAQYQKAVSYFNDAPSKIARDQSPAIEAALASEQLIARYPKCEFVDKAKLLLKRARIKSAEKESYIAKFYERRGANLAAYRRWVGITQSFNDLAEFPEAKGLLTTAEKRAGVLGEKLSLAEKIN